MTTFTPEFSIYSLWKKQQTNQQNPIGHMP